MPLAGTGPGLAGFPVVRGTELQVVLFVVFVVLVVCRVVVVVVRCVVVVPSLRAEWSSPRLTMVGIGRPSAAGALAPPGCLLRAVRRRGAFGGLPGGRARGRPAAARAHHRRAASVGAATPLRCGSRHALSACAAFLVVRGGSALAHSSLLSSALQPTCPALALRLCRLC